MPVFCLDGSGIDGWVQDGHLPANSPELVPLGYKFEAYPGRCANFVASIVMGGSGTMQATAIWLPAGVTIKKGAVMTGGTTAVTPTNQWLALTDCNGRVLGISADATTTAIPVNTLLGYTFGASFVTPYTGLYFLQWMVVAGTMPTLHGFSTTTQINSLPPILGGTSLTGQTTPLALNAAAAVTGGNKCFYGVLG